VEVPPRSGDRQLLCVDAFRLASVRGARALPHLLDRGTAICYFCVKARLFLREGTLMALPFGARRFEPAGDPFPVAEQVGAGW
jgi:hypothetical protein